MAGRVRDPKKDVERVLSLAEEQGWSIVPTSGGHRWGETADFDREAVDFAEALASAVKAVESTVAGARVVEVQRVREVAKTG